MKICMFLRNHFIHDTRVIKEARSLIAAGHEVKVIALWEEGLPALEVREDGIIVQRIGRPKNIYKRAPLSFTQLDLLLYFGRPWATDKLGKNELRSQWVFALGRFLSFAFLLKLYRLRVFTWVLMAVTVPFLLIGGIGLFAIRLVFMLTSQLRRIYNVSKRKSIFCSSSYDDFIEAGVQSGADVIHAHDLFTLLPAVLTARKIGAKIVYDSHELFVDRNARESFLRRWKWILLETPLIREVDAIITVSDSIAEALVDRYRIRRPAVIRNVQEYHPPHRSTELRKAQELRNVADGDCIAVYAGGITRGRGLNQLVEAAQYLEGGVIVMLGRSANGSYKEELLKKISSLGLERKVFLLPPVAPDLVHQYLCSADIGLMPTEDVCLSYRYGAGNKLFHYLMAGLPVVVSDQPEKRKIVQQYNVGRVCKAEDPQNIARAIQDLVDHTEVRRQLSLNCLEAAKILNWENEEKKLLELYQKILIE